MPDYFPIMLDVRGRQALVIGGDSVAAQKATSLLASGAEVVVQSEEFCEELLELAAQCRLSLRRKAYTPGDLAGAFVVIASTSDMQQARTLWAEAYGRGQPINIVDVPAYCSFIMPSVLRRGQLTVAVSTGGTNPSLAKRIRHQLEGSFPPNYDAYLRLATVARAHLRRAGVSYEQRDVFFGDFFASDILALLSEGETMQAVMRTATLLQAYGLDVEVSDLAAEFEEKVYVNAPG